MKIFFTIISASFLLGSISGYAQTKNNRRDYVAGENKAKKCTIKWTSSPYDNQVFIENNGQFDGEITSGEKILYGVQFGQVSIFFMGSGVIYRYDKYDLKNPAAEENEESEDLKSFKRESYFLSAEWKDASKSVNVLASDEKTNYYTYGRGLKGAIKANIFKHITYKNLYPGIDAEYEFVKGKSGIKYSLVVHPGADMSNIKINYSGIKKITKDERGNIIISSDMNTLTEHSPESYYQGESGRVSISNVLEGNTESFKANETYDKAKVLVIAPWITDPLFTTADRAYDLDWDYYGNVYAYGGNPNDFELVKMNSLGVIQWTYNATAISASGYYGDFCTDKVTGTSYLIEAFNSGSGALAQKVNSLGMLTGTFPGNTSIDELWRAEFDACNGDIVIGGGGTNGTYQAGVLDSNMTTINPVNIMGATGPYHDVTGLTIDPNGTQCYMTSAHTAATTIPLLNNDVMQLPLPSLSPTAYLVHENSHFIEVGSVPYIGVTGGIYTNAYNGTAASPNWLYLYDGDTIRRYNKNTGNYASQIAIRSVSNSGFDYGGLDVDACDNIFAGVADSLYVIDSTYTILDKIALQDTVYDVHLGENGMLYACGRGFVTQLAEPISARLITSSSGSPTSCSACNGTATVNVNCGVAPYSFFWSNGSTNQTDTGLCAGIYVVTVKDGACPPRSDTAIINIPGEAGFTASVLDTNPNCALAAGNITVYPNGGVSPYTYSWSNGETSQEDTGLGAGNYICTITDSVGCKFFIDVNLVNPITPTLTISPQNDSICAGTNLSLTASGVNTYSWTPTTGLSCYNCPSPTASPTTTVTYTVTGADTNGCTATATTTIKVNTIPKPVIAGKDSLCAGTSDTLSVSGATTYVWSNGATSSTIIVTTGISETITVTGSNSAACTHDTTFTIDVTSLSASITPSKDSVCSGDTVKLSGSGGVAYLWSTNSTLSTIIVSPMNQTTYTLYTTNGSCKDSSIITIGIIKPTLATISASPDSVCPGTNVIISVNFSSGTGSYKWSNGATTSSINVTDSVSTTYTATIFGKCDTVQNTITNKVIPLPKPVITGTNWKCHGVKDTLTVSGGATYLWSNGSTKSTYITGAIDGDSTISVIAFNSLGCSDTTSFTITVRSVPNIIITAPKGVCSGDSVSIVANATGTGPFTYSWSPGGETTDSISVQSPPDSTTTTYTVTVSNGCVSSKTITLTAEYPTLNTIGTQTIIIENDTTILWASGNSVEYFWQDSNLIVCLNPPLCDSVRVTPTVTTTYTVIGEDKLGCLTTGYVTVIIEVPCLDFKVPNVFTPNYTGANGHDNEFYIKTDNINSWSIQIFDRWGKEMYKSNNVYTYWDGNTESGNEAPDGVYYYIITGVCQDKTYKKQGFVQLIR